MEVFELVLTVFAKSLNVVLSWGFHSPQAIENGIEFRCNGFKFTGVVKVTRTDRNLYKVELMSNNGVVVEIIDKIHIGNLINVIDDKVEKVDDYEKRVMQKYFQ